MLESITRGALAAFQRPFPARFRAPTIVAMAGLLLVCLLLAMTWAASTPILDDIARFERSRLPKLQMLQVARSGDLDASIAVRNVLLVKDLELEARELARYAAATRSAAEALNAFAAHAHQPDEQELVRRTIDVRAAVVAAREEAIAADRRGETIDVDGLTRALQARLGDYLAQLDRLQAYQVGRVNALVDEMASRAGVVRWLLTVCGVVAAATLMFVAASWRAELKREVRLRDAHIASLRAQRSALIAEVHHRIKNHLQGLLGLIETHKRATSDSSVAGSLAGLHGHVLALVGVHGLQAKDSCDRVTVRELVRQQAEIVRTGFQGAHITVSDDPAFHDFFLPQEAAVPVALIVTELIVNAIKHGDASPIRIRLGSDGAHEAFISVRNGLLGAIRMDWATGHGLGTGLSLVSALAEGVTRLSQRTGPTEVDMIMHLAHSVPQ